MKELGCKTERGQQLQRLRLRLWRLELNIPESVFKALVLETH